jgi:predicted NBD/HSP70 family sugar kinase/biotin operon repressor
MAINKVAVQSAPRLIRTATPSSVRAVNRSIILDLIRRRQPVSRAELARITGIFRSSVSDIVDELISDGLVLEERARSLRRGRMPMSLMLNEGSYPVLGLNIRPQYSQIACAGLSGTIQRTWTFRTPGSPRKLVEAVERAISNLRREMSPKSQFRRMGVSVPGHIDTVTGRIVWTPTHPELSDFPIAEAIFTVTGIPTLADNDCNAGALSELWLSTQRKKDRASDFVFLNVSDFGTGAGAIVNGEIYLGHDSRFAAEAGHMVIEPDGVLCTCGRRGCWERYVSNYATWRRYRPRAKFTVAAFEEMLASVSKGNRQALETVHETARYLSLGISNIGFLFNPAEVVIAGRITAVWETIADELKSAFGSPHLNLTMRPARLSADDSLLHGAVCLALRDIFAAPKFGEA